MMKKRIYILLCILCIVGISFYLKHKTPLVSVVMPVYNRSDLASRAIESILNQTFTDFEFIIVDDGSDEETKKILKEYAKKDSRIRLIHNPKNRGIAYSRQRGLDAARGTYIATMDSDDWSVPDRLEKSVAFMADYPEVNVMTGELKNIEENQFIPNYTITNPRQYTLVHSDGFFEVELMFYNGFFNVASFFRREFVQKNHIRYDASLISAEDYDFWRQFALMGGGMSSISDVLVYVRQHSSNSSEYYQKMTSHSINIHKKMFLRFFVPTEKELKVQYTTHEKCQILKKIMSSNLKNPKMPQIYLENRYNAYCPADLDRSYYLVHRANGWEGYLEQLDENIWKRIETKDKGKLVKIGNDKIEVHWSGYPKESFVRQSDGTWEFIVEGEKIALKHMNWSDDFIIGFNNRGCRVKTKTECAKIKKISDDILWIDWMKDAWANEEFQKNKKGGYEFVRELNMDEKI